MSSPISSNNSSANSLNEVCLINRDLTRLPTDLDATSKRRIRKLDLSFNNLQSLEGLDEFPNLEELIVDNNELTDGLVFPRLTKLHTFTLNKNKLKDLEPLLEAIKMNFPSLSYISLLGNEACPNQLSSLDRDEDDYCRYRLLVLYHLPRLKFLDSSPVKASERQEAATKGKFLRPLRPKDMDDDNEKNSIAEISPYTPLPNNIRSDTTPKATFGKCRYVYYGRHSEGNRFIRNNDL